MSWLINKAIKAALARSDRKLWGQLERQASSPQQTQHDVLLAIVAANKPTTFGQHHRFADIESVADFREAVPVHVYADLKEAIDRQAEDGTPELTSELPTLYAQTSGTTGTPKYLPMTPTGLARQARAQRLVASMISRYSNVFTGRILAVGSPAVEGTLPSGKPYGSASGVILDGMPNLVRSRYLLDESVINMVDHEQRYFEIAKRGLGAKDLTVIATANPSTVQRIHQTIVSRWDELITCIAAADPQRGRELRQLDDIATLPFEAYWPDLEVMTSWTCGSCGLALERLGPLLPKKLKLFELGYTASELRGSVATGPGRTDTVPLIGDVYFEFVDQSAWEAGVQDFLGIEELVAGKQYYIFVTTIDGLYRYDMNDIVLAVDRFQQTPTIQFVQKGRGVTNITGEKLYESQLISAMQQVGGGKLPGSGFFVGLADVANAMYRIYVEGPLSEDSDEFERVLDQALCAGNIEYASKRQSGRLAAATVTEVRPGTGARYRDSCIEEGQRESQFKLQYLQQAQDCTFDFEGTRT